MTNTAGKMNTEPAPRLRRSAIGRHLDAAVLNSRADAWLLALATITYVYVEIG